MVDDSASMKRDVQSHYRQMDDAAEQFRAAMDDHISEFVSAALKCDSMDALTGVHGKGGQYPIGELMHECLDYSKGISTDDVLLMLAKVATGRAGQHEARDLLNRMAVESAYHFVEDTSESDRTAKCWLEIAGSVK